MIDGSMVFSAIAATGALVKVGRNALYKIPFICELQISTVWREYPDALSKNISSFRKL